MKQVGQVMHVVEHPELPLDDLLNQQRLPAPGGKAGRRGPGRDDLGQPLPLRRGELRRASAPPAHPQPGGPLREQGPQPRVAGRSTDPDVRGGRRHGLPASDLQQDRHPLHQR